MAKAISANGRVVVAVPCEDARQTNVIEFEGESLQASRTAITCPANVYIADVAWDSNNESFVLATASPALISTWRAGYHTASKDEVHILLHLECK